MENTVRSGPSLIPAFLALLILVLFGYLIFTDSHPSRTEHTLSPPIEIIEPEPELTVIEQSEQSPDYQQQINKDAEIFVDNLAPKQAAEHSITINENADQFVRHDSTIDLPKVERRHTTIKQLLNDSTLTAETPVTLSYIDRQQVPTTLAELARLAEDQTEIVTIVTTEGEILSAPLADLLHNPELDKNAAVFLLQETRQSRQLTAGELDKADIDHHREIEVTISRGIQQLSVKNIIQAGDLPDNALFYLHRVTEQDRQGLWGIIQAGLIEKFREGLHIEGISVNRDTMQVTIPADADERLPSGFSSFLGKILNNKVTSSYVYNFSTHTMGRDPDLIYPGQQLILIHFSAEELQKIYTFFAEKRGKNVKSFAIPG